VTKKKEFLKTIETAVAALDAYGERAQERVRSVVAARERHEAFKKMVAEQRAARRKRGR